MEPQQPDEIPYREQLHDFPDDGGQLDGFDFIAGMGHVKDEVFHGWESQAAERAYWAERKRADAARAALGGFGFRIERARPPL